MPAPVVADLRPPEALPAGRHLEQLLPAGGLLRGTTVHIGPGVSTGDGPLPGDAGTSLIGMAPGSTSLLCTVLAGASSAGYWCAVTGLPELGLVAASELGVDLARLVLVPSPGPEGRWQGVIATLLETVDLVCLVPAGTVRPGDARRLETRARERAAVLVVFDRGERRRSGSRVMPRWPGPGDLRLAASASLWSGLGQGHGVLTGHRLEAEVGGRGAASRVRRGQLELSA